MARRPRRNHGSAFRAKASAAVIEGEKTLIELAQDPDVHPNQIERWRDQLLVGRLHVAALAAHRGELELQHAQQQERHSADRGHE